MLSLILIKFLESANSNRNPQNTILNRLNKPSSVEYIFCIFISVSTTKKRCKNIKTKKAGILYMYMFSHFCIP